MINPHNLFNFFLKKINFFTGVPDSVLKNFINVIPDNKNHIIATNEGSAISMVLDIIFQKSYLVCIFKTQD